MGVTQREKREKLAHVERTIAERGWSPRIVSEIADQFGVCNRTVYKWRLQVLEEIADNQRGIDRELARAEYLIRVQDHTRAARDAESFGPVASLLRIEGTVTGALVDGTAAHEDETTPAGIETVIERLRELPAPVRDRLLRALQEGPAVV